MFPLGILTSFLENFFLQIKEKYDKDQVKALQKIKTDRKRFAEELEKSISYCLSVTGELFDVPTEKGKQP